MDASFAQYLGSNKNPVTLVILGMILRVLVWSMMLLSIGERRRGYYRTGSRNLGVGGIAITAVKPF